MRRIQIISLVSALVLTLCLSAGIWFSIQTARAEMTGRAENSAQMWLRILMAEEKDLSLWLQGEGIPDAVQKKLLLYQQSTDVLKFKFYDSAGHTVFESGQAEFHHHDHSAPVEEDNVLRQVMTTGKPFTEICDGSHDFNAPEHFAESYVPIFDNGELVGVFEAYIDVTDAADSIRTLLFKLVTTIIGLVVMAMLFPFGLVALYWARLKKNISHLKEERQRAEEAESAKSDFLTQMSHELRTPMNGMFGMFELLEKSGLNAEQRSIVDTISHSSRAFLQITDDLLDFSKIEAGRLELVNAPFNLRQLAEDVAIFFAPGLAKKSVGISIESDLPDRLSFHGDATRIRQCLLNLVGNAAKFTMSGHIHISIRLDEEEQVVISVSDTGVGIGEDQLDKIFQAFSQIEKGATRSFDGTGLGLTITSELAQMMNGSLTVSSVLGEGSVFELCLPLQRVDASQQNKIFWAKARQVVAGKRILISESKTSVSQSLATSLTHLGAAPVCFSSGKATLEEVKRLHSSNDLPDVCLLDCGMHDIRGDLLLDEIQAVTDGKLPCIIMLRADRDHAAKDIKKRGFAGGLRKPAKLQELTLLLAEVFDDDTLVSHHVSDPSADDAPDLSTVRILLAEDNRTNQLVVQKLLKNTGASIDLANNGLEAVELYESLHPDLVLMDISMPEMNGHEATQLIRSIEEKQSGSCTPILALTANVMPEDRKAAHASGMNGFLPKPVGRAKLIDTILSHLGPKSAA